MARTKKRRGPQRNLATSKTLYGVFWRDSNDQYPSENAVRWYHSHKAAQNYARQFPTRDYIIKKLR